MIAKRTGNALRAMMRLSFAAAFAALGQTLVGATYKVDIDRPEGIYRCGETATFTVRLLSTNGLTAVKMPYARLDNFGTSVQTNLPFDVTSTDVVFTVSGTLREPGFLRLSLPPTKNGGADPSVFSVGFEPERIRKGSPSPADFDSFWAAARARLAREVPLDAQMVRVPERSTEKFDFYRISFATFGRRVHGYMSVPTDRSKAPFPVDFGVNAAGFGSWTNDMTGENDSIRVQFSVYPFAPDWKWRESGLESSYKAMDAAAKAKYGAARYCQAGITESREAYFFYPVILGIDRAIDWIAARPDVDRSRFRYQGTSQGGGFGFYLCGLNHAFTRAVFYVPAITDTMGYLKGRDSGWPKIVENNSSTKERRAAAEKWAPYFDGANFAPRIKCPVRVAVGFSDMTCPPCAVYAAYNEINVADKAIGNGIGMTHSCSRRFYSEFGAWAKSEALANDGKACGASGERIMERATPESQGVKSSAISAWIDACERTFDGGKMGRLHGFVIVRHGKVIAEGSWKPFDTLNETHMLYSHSKSFTSSAIGFLVDDGKLDLDERVAEIFPECAPQEMSENLKALRVRDLLTMNVGADYTDAERKDPSGDWVRLFLANDVNRKPGTGFKYDSCATYMLAAIVERKSGKKLMDFLDEKMFRRIGITKAWSTTSPQGIACGGWGMNMTTRELARFGQLYLQKGFWGGQPVISSEWVALATARHTWSSKIVVQSETIGSGSDWSQGYGFQFWRCRHNCYRADGASGQYTIVMPEQDAVVSIHAGLRDMQKEIDLVWDHLLPAMENAALPEDESAASALARRCATLAIPPVSGNIADGAAFLGKTFILAENDRGFTSVRFDRQGAGWMCTLGTPAGEQRFPVGSGEWSRGRVRVDTATYEGLGGLIGELDVAASGGIDGKGDFRMRAYLTGTTAYLDFSIDAAGKCTGTLFAMGGCDFQSRQ